MRKIVLTTVLCLIVCFIYAQRDTVRLREIEKNTKNVVTDRAPQAVYIQIGGSAPLFSINYDRRLSKRVNGIGFAAGIGYYGESGITIFSIPVSVNYLFGKSNSFLELAAGATYVSAQASLFNSDNSSASLVFYHLNLGYRHQPTRGGFFFRGGISPLFAQGESVTSFYIGFGHNF